DQIETHQDLVRIIRLFLQSLSPTERFLLLLDEVTYVTGWDRAVKALADEGFFRRGFCLITGSDSLILKEAMSRFPGRRGEADKTDFRLRPLDFREYVELVSPVNIETGPEESGGLFPLFENYLQCGGHLRAINDLHQKGIVSPATFQTFAQWIQGDFEKRGKSTRHLMGVLKMILETTPSQVTYSSLVQRMGEVSKPTFMDYCELLERIDLIFSLEAFDQNRRLGFPKKARKFHFWDPFLLETVKRWLEKDGFLSPRLDWASVKAEAVTAAHFRKNFQTFYVKGNGEIDLVIVSGNKNAYLEVKWAQQIRSLDLAELKKHKPAFILTKQIGKGSVDGIDVYPLPYFLLHDAALLMKGF
ncbi:MAG: ATP-binding protein, partial [bacterium]|nr:ATP-binding protein [bacterium]